ncbi:hypothetical protein [Vibrio vulnificus]|uniref:hypothetical protein n=1 Tax=Vibrio vulnificus TaxID=672 RepID=UPI001CDC23A6|nr:hypothetical protein [Vibrio vulnificus]ELG9630524.1 hypothetical protein [Vibrio vulnificus]MCA4019664.1 hypothetical protein [Vibrio vulnificus]
MQVRFHDDFAKKQYKKLSGAYRAKNIALMACHFTNITFRYGGQYASDLALFIQKTEEWKRERAIALYMPKGTYSHFKGLSICKYPYPVFAKIKQIRKQEEAPEALAVDGAESSCPVKKILRCDHHIHADLIIKAGEQVEVIEKYPADSLVSHPQCKGFFAWNDQLEDLNSRRGGLREQLRNARKMQQEGATK